VLKRSSMVSQAVGFGAPVERGLRRAGRTKASVPTLALGIAFASF